MAEEDGINISGILMDESMLREPDGMRADQDAIEKPKNLIRMRTLSFRDLDRAAFA